MTVKALYLENEKDVSLLAKSCVDLLAISVQCQCNVLLYENHSFMTLIRVSYRHSVVKLIISVSVFNSAKE